MVVVVAIVWVVVKVKSDRLTITHQAGRQGGREGGREGANARTHMNTHESYVNIVKYVSVSQVNIRIHRPIYK